ncbi:restriction endonuclease subunit S [Oscillospiraceae bacterium 50-58]
MREMKPSSMEWIGDIPLSWKVMPNKYLMHKKKEICPAYNGEDILSLTMKGVIVRDLDAGGKMPASFDGYQRLEPGNLLMCLFDIDVTPRCIGLIKQAGLSSPAYSQFVLSDSANAAYYCYYYTMLDNDKTLLHLAKNLRHSLTEDQLGAIPVIVPPIDEQQRIADFLDAKCAEIDALTADIQAQIDTLEQYKRSVITETVTKGLNLDAEMKDSGVFYMAPMNASWRLTKIGYICTKLSRSFVSEDTALICSNKGKVQIRADDLTGIMVSDDNAMQGIRAGDIAIHGMDTWHGAIALSEFDGKITRVVHVCDSTEDKRFIVYYMQHLAFQGVYKLISNGVRGNTSDFRSWDKVRDIWIAIPKTRQEQEAICDYLDRQCNAVEEVISTKKQQLEVLATYKKSLIFEYVTGKKEVPLS